MPRRVVGQPLTVARWVRLPVYVDRELRRRAALERRPVSHMIRILLEDGLRDGEAMVRDD